MSVPLELLHVLAVIVISSSFMFTAFNGTGTCTRNDAKEVLCNPFLMLAKGRDSREDSGASITGALLVCFIAKDDAEWMHNNSIKHAEETSIVCTCRFLNTIFLFDVAAFCGFLVPFNAIHSYGNVVLWYDINQYGQYDDAMMPCIIDEEVACGIWHLFFCWSNLGQIIINRRHQFLKRDRKTKGKERGTNISPSFFHTQP